MQSTIFDTPFIKIDSLKTKFDTLVLSNSFIAVVGDHIEALFLHQLHYWSYSQYGVVIDDTRWIYKPLKEWLSEVFTFLSEWKLRVAIASLLEKGLIEREKLFVKHHELKHDNPYWHPKNQTYYYSVNYDKLQELIERAENRSEEVKNAETVENVRLENLTELSVEDFSDTKCCELSQNKTNITSIKNYSKDQSHPTLPSVCDRSTENNQDKRTVNKLELTKVLDFAAKKKVDSVKSKVIEKDKSFGQVEENINQNISTNKADVRESLREGKGEGEKGKENKNLSPNSDVQEPVQVEADGRGLGGFPHERPVQEVEKPKLKKTPKGTKPNRKGQAPWKDEGQFKRFYRALVQALPIVANSHSPQGLAQTIIRQLRSGIPHSYWDDFVAGLPIGSSTKPEWEVEPGIPHPMFIEYLVEKLIKGNNSQTREQAMVTALNIASTPKQAIFFWKECKISLGNALDEAERHRKLGVKALPTPLWTKERPEPTIQEAAIAGTKIQQINNSTQASLEAAKNPQIEGKSEPSTDPWQDDRPQPTMREMLAARKVKGFCQQMPKISQAEIEAEERAEIKPKTNIATMAIAEINDYLKDPILRKQLMPQLWDSNYELILDYLGQIIGVKAPPPVEE